MQALALIYLFGRNGLVTAHLFETDWNIYGPVGIIISEVMYCLPHSFVILFTTLSAVDIRLDVRKTVNLGWIVINRLL